MRIGVIGTGQVGDVLANGFLAHGHSVIRGTRDPAKLADWATTRGDEASAGTMQETARAADLAAPSARFVKAFSCVGNVLMVDPDLTGGRPTMFICGNDAKAKSQASDILDDFGWDIEDLGGAAAARAIEPLCMLWCIPGFLRNDWAHAYKVLRPK